MSNFRTYGKEFADRYRNAIAAADDQREKDASSTQALATNAYNDVSMSVGSPEPPAAPQEGQEYAPDDPALDKNVDETKEYLINRSKQRMDKIVAPADEE